MRKQSKNTAEPQQSTPTVEKPEQVKPAEPADAGNATARTTPPAWPGDYDTSGQPHADTLGTTPVKEQDRP